IFFKRIDLQVLSSVFCIMVTTSRTPFESLAADRLPHVAVPGQTGQMLFLLVLLHFSLKTFPYIKLWPGFFLPNNAFEFDSITISIFTPLSNLSALIDINNDTTPIDNKIVIRTPASVIISG